MSDEPSRHGTTTAPPGSGAWRPPLMAGERFEQARLTVLGHFALWAFGKGDVGWYVVQARTSQGTWVVLVDGSSTLEKHEHRRAADAMAGAQSRGLAWLWGVLQLAGDRLTELVDDGHSTRGKPSEPVAPASPGRGRMLTPIT
ncbi:MAG: hypothetical protein KC549_07625 [Myxococcales bacterium]|nr:hypothetical protein [Myxococcales bacterium]MCB9549008.1 hypothetical protein [Myxococcales bacterium]